MDLSYMALLAAVIGMCGALTLLWSERTGRLWPRLVLTALMVLAALAVASCGSKVAPPMATPAPTAPADAEEVAAAPPDAAEDCESGTPLPAKLGGVDGNVELLTCTTRTERASATEELYIRYQEATLVFHRPRGDVRTVIGTWTQGWEWGRSMELAGVLVGPRGEGAVLVTSRFAGPGDSRMSLSVYALAKDELVEAWARTAQSLDLRIERGEVHLGGCEASARPTPEDASDQQGDTCGAGPLGPTGRSPQRPIAPRTLTWNGTAIVER